MESELARMVLTLHQHWKAHCSNSSRRWVDLREVSAYVLWYHQIAFWSCLHISIWKPSVCAQCKVVNISHKSFTCLCSNQLIWGRFRADEGWHPSLLSFIQYSSMPPSPSHTKAESALCTITSVGVGFTANLWFLGPRVLGPERSMWFFPYFFTFLRTLFYWVKPYPWFSLFSDDHMTWAAAAIWPMSRTMTFRAWYHDSYFLLYPWSV